MAAVRGSLVAVLGTRLKSLGTQLFQQRAAVRVEARAREELRRRELLAAYSGFAAAVTELKRALVTGWLRRSGRTALESALAEADRLGAVAETARFRLRLLSGRPEPLADSAFARAGALRDAADVDELKTGEAEFDAAVTVFIADAAERPAAEHRRTPVADGRFVPDPALRPCAASPPGP
jgi:hypothetical protein